MIPNMVIFIFYMKAVRIYDQMRSHSNSEIRVPSHSEYPTTIMVYFLSPIIGPFQEATAALKRVRALDGMRIQNSQPSTLSISMEIAPPEIPRYWFSAVLQNDLASKMSSSCFFVCPSGWTCNRTYAHRLERRVVLIEIW